MGSREFARSCLGYSFAQNFVAILMEPAKSFFEEIGT